MTASQITRVQFDYDRAATLSVGLVAPSGAVIPTGTYGIAMTVANSNLTVGYKSYQQAATGSGTTRTITPLFPYASGYQVWTGDCADADPAAYTGGSRGAVLASNQGATTTGSAALDAVDVTVRRTSATGTLVSGATVSAIHAAGTGCTAGETLTTTTTTNASGQLRLALPYGTWTIRAVSGSPDRDGHRHPRPGHDHRPGADRGGPVTARRRADRGQAGVTLVEMAVVVALLGLVLTMAFQGLVSYQRATASADTRQQNLDQARTVMAVLTKDLRTATEFTTMTATDVTFTGLLNTAATAPANQLRLYVDSGGVLREAVTAPDNPTASPLTYTGTPTTRVVGQGLVSTSGLLSFRDSSDAVTTSLTAVTSVIVTVSVDLPSRSGGDVPPTVLSSRVFLPNVAASASEA